MMERFKPSYFQLLNILMVSLLECQAQTQRHCSQVHQLNINCFKGDTMSISCLTTFHPLESLTVKLRSITQDKDILKYPDISPASEHQRWSLREDAGNVTLDLKGIRLSDDGHYDCEVYKDQDCLHATRFILKVKECEKLNSVHATFNSSVLLQCNRHQQKNIPNQVTWKVVGHQPIDITQYRHPNNPSSSTEKLPKPFNERARQLKNGSLLIRDTVQADELWYQCRVNEKTCYEMKLQMKSGSVETPSTTLITTVITEAPAPADTTAEDIKSNENQNTSANLTAVVMITVVCLSIFISLIICMVLYFKSQRHKFNRQTELNCWSTVYYSSTSGGLGGTFYSLEEHNTKIMTPLA